MKREISMSEALEFIVAGVKYSNYRSKLRLKAGRKCNLTWERTNKFDPNAIRIDVSSIKIGYVPSILTKYLHALRKANIRIYASITRYTPSNASWAMIYVTVKIETKEHLPQVTQSFLNG